MSIVEVDAKLVGELAAALELPIGPAEAEELARQLSLQLAQAERLRALDLDAVEPASIFRLEADER